MNILVVGGGAREHALAWRLSHEAEVVVAPGNPGIADSCETAAVSPKDDAGRWNFVVPERSTWWLSDPRTR